MACFAALHAIVLSIIVKLKVADLSEAC